MARTQNARSRSGAEAARNRALIYIRKSIVRSGADQISPERQRANCLDEAQRHGWLVEEGDIYVDAEGHQSGRDDSRIAWQRLRRRLRQDETVVAVIVESLSRASRSVRSFFEFVEELRARGIGLVSLKERFDTSNAIGQAMLGFIAVVNQLESDLASERMSMNIAFKKSRGRHWGLTPFGCAREAVTGALRPGEDAYTLNGLARSYYDALVALYTLYRTGEYSLKAAAREMNAAGWRFRGRQGQPRLWDQHNVRSVLMMHRVYAGWVPLEGHNKDRPSEWVAANYPPVLPVDLCDAVREALDARSRTWRLPEPSVPKGTPSPYVLRGILYCAECGARLKGYRVRGMRHYRHQTRGDCTQSWILADAIEAETEAILECLHLPPTAAHLAVEALLDALEGDAREESRAEIEAIETELLRVSTEQDRLVQIAINTGLDAAVYQSNIQRLEGERALLTARRREIEALGRAELSDLESILAHVGQMVSLLSHEAEPGARRSLMHGILARVEVRDGHIAAWSPRDWCRPFF